MLWNCCIWLRFRWQNYLARFRRRWFGLKIVHWLHTLLTYIKLRTTREFTYKSSFTFGFTWSVETLCLTHPTTRPSSISGLFLLFTRRHFTNREWEWTVCRSLSDGLTHCKVMQKLHPVLEKSRQGVITKGLWRAWSVGLISVNTPNHSAWSILVAVSPMCE